MSSGYTVNLVAVKRVAAQLATVNLVAVGLLTATSPLRAAPKPAAAKPEVKAATAAKGSAPAKQDGKSGAAPAGKITVGADGVRRDPAGVKGISPYQELIVKGDKAYVAKDLDGALTAYTDAIKLEPKVALGHYQQGQVFMKKGDMKSAEDSFMSGLRFAYKSDPVRLKLLFVLSELRERQHQVGGALAVWREYTKLYTDLEVAQKAKAEAGASKPAETKEGASKPDEDANKAPVGFPKTAEERQAKATAYEALVKASAAVKERIEQRLKEAAPK